MLYLFRRAATIARHFVTTLSVVMGLNGSTLYWTSHESQVLPVGCVHGCVKAHILQAKNHKPSWNLKRWIDRGKHYHPESEAVYVFVQSPLF